MRRIRVKTAAGSYPILPGTDLSGRLGDLVRKHLRDGRLFLFCDANFYALHGLSLRRSLKLPNRRVCEFVVPSGEKSKSPRTLAGIYDFMLDEQITRHDFVLACGGGVTGDLVGYAAATVLRGVRWGIVSTTLLGMVDASIGGKTGINHGRGKNLIGAFWPPTLVGSNIDYLTTLPPREMIAGLGEVAKTAGLASGDLVTRLRRYLQRGDLYDRKSLSGLIAACAAYKASVVERDEREAGVRAVLNFGHTFGHGIERALGFGRLRHGEAVIVGLDAALGLGERLGYESRSLREYRDLIGHLMRFVPRREVDLNDVLDAMLLDKKRSVADQKYVVLKGIGRPIVRGSIDRRKVRSGLSETLKRYRELGGKGVK